MQPIAATAQPDRSQAGGPRTGRAFAMGRRRRQDRQARRERRARDLVLVEGILRGEDDAFRELVERYQRPLYWIARDILLDGDEARDVVQETFIRVHAALDRFDRSRDLQNWMFRIARNLAIDHYRRRRRRATPVDDLTHAGEEAESVQAPSADLGDQVAEVLAALPVDYRMALTLREFHGLTPREIARVSDCSYPTARWRLHRARALFREAWEERFGTAPVFEGGSA